MYTNQKAVWNSVVVPPGVNSYGDFQYGADVIIDVRRQEHVEEVTLKDGSVHYTKYVYYTKENVHVDDKLDGNLVVNLYDMRSLGGNKRMRRLLTI